jgi:hypothetical protein
MWPGRRRYGEFLVPTLVRDTCPGATLDDLIACVDTSADAITDELLALQFPTSYPTPAESPDATPAAPTPTVTATP